MFKDFIDKFREVVKQQKAEKGDIPQPIESDIEEKGQAAFNSQRYAQIPEGTPEPTAVYNTEVPLSYDDIQSILPYKQFFDMNMDLYSREPDQEKRIKLLDFMGTKTPLGRLPGTARYLQIMRNTEDAVKREGTTNYQYGETAKHFQDILNGEISKFGPHRA